MYSQEQFDEKKAPHCVFVPSDEVFNKMIVIVAKGGDNMDLVLAKFNDYLPPKAQWLIYLEMNEKK